MILDELSVRTQAVQLVDSVLEQSVLILTERADLDAQLSKRHDEHSEQDEYSYKHENHMGQFFDDPPVLHVNVADNFLHSDSENFAITCDLSNGAEFLKSPTIESISGKSFDENMSPQEEHDLIGLGIQSSDALVSVPRDEISRHLEKLSWEDSNSATNHNAPFSTSDNDGRLRGTEGDCP